MKALLLLLIWTTFLSCGKKEQDITPNPITEKQLKEDVAKLELKGDEGVAALITDAESVEETVDGYKVDGSIGAELEGGSSFNIAEGSFEFVVDINGNIISITGEGSVDFPNVGIFKNIRENFDWKKVKSHIEYEKGKFYKDTYSTDIPLNDDRYYFHFQVFDESDKEGFSLKHLGNLVVYNFTDFYLDINDPAVFFKMQLWKPGSGAKSETTSIAKKLFNKAVAVGKATKEYASAPGVIFGISNQATIKTSSYEFSKPDVFEELYGYSGFDELYAHGFVRLKNIPIPETVILRFTGDMYVHGPLEKGAPAPADIIEKRKDAYVDWFNESELGPVSRTMNGSIDFGGKGIGAVFGILNGIDDALGYDVLNNDFNFDLVGAAYQEQNSGLDLEASSFMRFGGEFSKPILADLFGEKISKFIPTQPASTGFLYFNIEDDLDKWSLFIESSTDIIVPFIGKRELNNSYFLLSKDGIFMEGNMNLPSYGDVFTFDQKFKGSLRPDGFDVESSYDYDITLPNGITLGSRSLLVKVSSDISKGLYLEGNISLPLGISEANVLAVAKEDKVFFEGSFSQGLDLGFGYDLLSRNMTFSTSTDPAEGISFKGELEIPHLGFVDVTGVYNNSEFEFTGKVNTTIDFNGVKLPIVDGDLVVNSSGMTINGKFTPPYGLKTAQMSGTITKEEIKLSGAMKSGITVAGTTFTFSSSYINASSKTGVSMGGKINLKRFSINVNGVIYPGGTFQMTGSYNYSAKLIKTSVNATVTQAGVSLKGNGTIYGVLGNALYSGSVVFQPNWAAGTIKACISGYCVSL